MADIGAGYLRGRFSQEHLLAPHAAQGGHAPAPPVKPCHLLGPRKCADKGPVSWSPPVVVLLYTWLSFYHLYSYICG